MHCSPVILHLRITEKLVCGEVVRAGGLFHVYRYQFLYFIIRWPLMRPAGQLSAVHIYLLR